MKIVGCDLHTRYQAGGPLQSGESNTGGAPRLAI